MMISLLEYKIAHKGLKNGLHHLEFDIEDSFFSHFEMSKIKKGSIKLSIDLDKRDNMLVLDFEISGEYDAPCDRCMNQIGVPVEGADQIIIKFVEEPQDDTDEVIFRNVKDTHLDLTELIYELIHVQLPINALRDCEAEDYKYCDHDVLDVLEGETDTDEQDGDDDDDPINPLWQGLKDIKIE